MNIEEKLRRYALILKKGGIAAFEYRISEDRLLVYNENLELTEDVEHCLSFLETDPELYPEDRRKAADFFQRRCKGPVEIRRLAMGRKVIWQMEEWLPEEGEGEQPEVIFGSFRDVTMEKQREERLEKQAKRDALTMLYNQYFGKELINDYLLKKDPYASCGLMVLDIDYFKNVNDTYGHAFGDQVLKELALLLNRLFQPDDIRMRAGGDEFVILLKDISHPALVKRAVQLVKEVRRLTFPEKGYAMTCSVGVCYLSENVSGYTYDQLFQDADWALYQAKENGRNRYVFCDDLRRFAAGSEKPVNMSEGIDARYMRNDIVSTAFEIFEKMNSFDAAMELLMKVVGIRLQLNRITVIRTDIKGKRASRQYQWTSDHTPQVLDTPGSFTKEDFLTLFHSYDDYGTVVLQYDEMGQYSPQAQALLIQGEARTVVYAAMYCEGKYTGAISYVACGQKRIWSKENRRQFGELTKIVSAHLAKSEAMNSVSPGTIVASEYDPLTGLLSFSKFREEVEHLIVGGYARSHVLVYSDFEDFKYLNQKYGYRVGDQVLKEFADYIIGTLRDETNVYFTRVVSDQFILFMPYQPKGNTVAQVYKLNEEFALQQSLLYPDMHLRIRTGIYFVDADCMSASAAIDAANFARKQIRRDAAVPVKLYDAKLQQKQKLENELITGMGSAMKEEQFKVFLQPRFSLENHTVVGAEALVRLQRPDGTLVPPDVFIPLYEENGKIVDLDFYVFEKVAQFLAKNNRLGRKQVPISVNASICHAADERTVRQYLDILEKYDVDPSLTEIELTETATVSDYDNVRQLFGSFQRVHMMTAMDDFGAGYSVLNTVIDIPVNTVKIDRGFVKNCEKSEKGIYLLQQMVSLVKGLGYHVVCEGLETDSQVELLKQAGCEEGQGFWFARPMPMEEYEKMMYPEENA
ncbi:MAG: diguanylate cyclase [Lachnospiraceae bacterium]|nr:diguanylate cyclase [Lachnospiraceae bacterium]